MDSEQHQEHTTPEDWKKKTEERRKKQEDILPKASDTYEMKTDGSG